MAAHCVYVCYGNLGYGILRLGPYSKGDACVQWSPLESLQVQFYKAKLAFSGRCVAI